MSKVDSIFPADTAMWQIPYHMEQYRNTLEELNDFIEATSEFINLLTVQGVITGVEEIKFRMKLFEYQQKEIIRINTKTIIGK